MATYYQRYDLAFDDIHPVTPAKWDVQIWVRDDTSGGTGGQLAGIYPLVGSDTPLTITTGTQSDDKFEPILGTEVTIGVVLTDGIPAAATPYFIAPPEPEDFFAQDETKYKVIILKNGITYWTGFVKPDYCEFPYAAKPYVFNIVAADRIALLKTSLCDIQDVVNGNGLVPVIEMLTTRGLYKTLVGNTLNLLSSLVHPTPTGMTYPLGSQQTFFDQLLLRYELFWDDSQNQPVYIYDALTMIARSFGGRIFFSNNTFWFQRINDLRTASPMVSLYTTNDTPDSQATQSIQKLLKGDIASGDGIYSGANTLISIDGAHKVEKLDVNYILRGYLQNYSWAAFLNGQFSAWNSYIFYYNTQSVATDWSYITQHGDGSIQTPYSCAFTMDSSGTHFIMQEVLGIKPGDIYTLKFTVKFYGVQLTAYQVHLYQDYVSKDQDSHFYFDGSNWKQASSNKIALLGGPIKTTIAAEGNNNYHIKVNRPSDLGKNEVTINITFPAIPDYGIDIGTESIIGVLAPNIMHVLFIDPDVSVNDGTGGNYIEIGAVSLEHKPFSYTGETNTMTIPANYSIQNDDSDGKIIDGSDAWANSIEYGTYGANSGQMPDVWHDTFLSSTYAHTMNLRSIAEQNRTAYQKMTLNIFSNTIEFYNTIQQTFGQNRLFMQLYDQYDVKKCDHNMQLLELTDPTGATATWKQTYKF